MPKPKTFLGTVAMVAVIACFIGIKLTGLQHTANTMSGTADTAGQASYVTVHSVGDYFGGWQKADKAMQPKATASASPNAPVEP